MAKPRRWTDEQLVEAVKECDTMHGVIKMLGLAVAGGTAENIKRHMERLGLSFALDWKERRKLGYRALERYCKRYKDEELFILNSEASKTTIRKRYLELRGDVGCDICGISEWEGQKLTFHIDHINGDRNNDTIENLRTLCPNCHSLTPTYGGKNKSLYVPE